MQSSYHSADFSCLLVPSGCPRRQDNLIAYTSLEQAPRERGLIRAVGTTRHATGHIRFVSNGFQQINVIKVYVLGEANRMGLFHLKDQKKIVTNVVENYFDIAFLVPNHN